MKVIDMFVMSDKTAFVGTLETSERFVGRCICKLIVDGQERARLTIEGESLFRPDLQSLWTREKPPVDKEEIRGKEVWLIPE